jgi:hypothetical protein
VLVVGNAKEFDKPLSSLGSVKEINIAIPPPAGAGEIKGGQNSESKPSDLDGISLANKVATAMGGLDKLKAVKAIHAVISENEPGGPPAPVDITLAFPDSMHVDVQTPQGQLTIVASPDTAFMSMGTMGARSMPPAQKSEMLAQIHHDLIYIAQHAGDLTFTFTSAGSEQIGDVKADIVDIGGAVPWVRWYVDPKTGYILREKYHGLGPSGAQFDGQTDLSDWRTADGLMLPYLHKNQQNGKETSIVEYKKIEINPPVDAKLFQKPAETGTQP